MKTQLKDLAQFAVQNWPNCQCSRRISSSTVRWLVGSADHGSTSTYQAEAHEMSVMDVVDALSSKSNLISFLLVTFVTLRHEATMQHLRKQSGALIVDQINDLPLKSVNRASVMVRDIGHAKDSGALQQQTSFGWDGSAFGFISLSLKTGSGNSQEHHHYRERNQGGRPPIYSISKRLERRIAGSPRSVYLCEDCRHRT